MEGIVYVLWENATEVYTQNVGGEHPLVDRNGT